MSSIFTKSIPHDAYCANRESYQAWPAAVSPRTPHMCVSQGQGSLALPASRVVYVEPAMVLLASYDLRGTPRMMWMPKPRPMAWIRSASDLKPLLPVADGYLLVAGR